MWHFSPFHSFIFSYHICFLCVHVYEVCVEGFTCVTAHVWMRVRYVCRRVYMCHSLCVKVTVQPERTSSLFPLCRSQGWTRVFKDLEASTFSCEAISLPVFLPFKASQPRAHQVPKLRRISHAVPWQKQMSTQLTWHGKEHAQRGTPGRLSVPGSFVGMTIEQTVPPSLGKLRGIRTPGARC